jgi:putative hemolysin
LSHVDSSIVSLWIVVALVFILDLILVVIRASLLNASLPHLITLGAERSHKPIEPTLALLERTSLRVGLRFAISICHLLLAGAALLLIMQYYPGITIGVAILMVFLVGLVMVSVEFLFERAARRAPEQWLVKLTPLAKFFDIFLRPFSGLLSALKGNPDAVERQPGSVTEDELKSWVQTAENTGGLEKDEREMIYSIFHFGDTLCREIMVPRIDILALEVNTPVSEAVQALTVSGHSRVPVYEETIDNVVGLLYAKDLLRATLEEARPENIRPFLRPAYFVPEAKKVDELLREMQAHSIHLAVVVDEYGGMAGLVTLEDIVEEIVGEIRDEYDQSEELLVQQISPEEYTFSGRVDLDEFNDTLGTHLDTDLADTLGGYLYGVIGRVPVGGEQVRLEHWDLTIEQVSGRRIRKIHALRVPLAANSDEVLDDIRP